MMTREAVWTQAVESQQLADVPVVYKHAGRQIALFRASGKVYAVDNRCPHEGYPLSQGTVDEQCQLTCNWHNWKFRLGDGECVLGGDDVRAYPVKEEKGFVWIDLADPPSDVIQKRIMKGLRTAFREREFGRICREVTRLKLSGFDPLHAVQASIQWSYDHLEFGTTHAYAAAADWLSEAERYPDDWEKQLICLAEAIDHMANDALRQPEFPFAPPQGKFRLQLLANAIEAENREQAEELVQHAFDADLHWHDLEELFVAAALAHYNDFGHSLIYVYKTRQLVERMPNVERELSLALVRSLCYATREDLIPEFSGYATTLLTVPATTGNSKPADSEPLGACPFPATTQQALAWVAEQWPLHEAVAIYDRLLEALARNMLHYDKVYGSAWNRPVSDNVGWLDFTHGITFGNAVRACCTRYPQYWPQALLQMACFLGRNRAYLDEQIDVTEWLVEDESQFLADVREQFLDHGFRDPIFSAHLVKTTVAVEEELANASPSSRKYLLASLNRFLHSPLKQKHVRRLARQAIDLVERDYGVRDQTSP